jgi:hypothetical protein
MTTPERAEINRRNAQKSTGPKTAEGKDRSRFNAVKHGMAAKTLVLPGEDPEAFQMRIEAWSADLQPQDDVEQYLVDRAAAVSWQLDRADRADTARLADLIRTAPAEEAHRQEEEAVALGRRLFWDRRGPMALYPHYDLRDELLAQRNPRTSFSGLADDPDDPDRLVHRLESTAAGCRWMLNRWTELRDLLDQGYLWQSPDKLKAIRLLGHQPIDAADDTDVTDIFLACWVLDPENRAVDPFAELWKELLPGEENLYRPRLKGREAEDWLPEGEDAARGRLRKIVDRATTRLEALALAHRERAQAEVADQAARLSFDASMEGERLRRYQMSCNRALFRTLDMLLKLRRSASSGSGKRSGECGGDRPSPVAAETVAETYARILFDEDDVLARAASRETHREHRPEESENGIRRFTAEAAEIAETTTGNNRENQPTTAAGDDRNRQNEPTDPLAPESRPEPVAVKDHRDFQNEPTPPANDRRTAQDPAKSSVGTQGKPRRRTHNSRSAKPKTDSSRHPALDVRHPLPANPHRPAAARQTSPVTRPARERSSQ